MKLSGLTLPPEVVTETVGVVGKKGSGKTYTSKVLTEEMYRAGLPVCVIDPLGVWWGLRSSSDGKGEGYPFVVLGGDHADVPLEPTAGEVVADFVIENGGWVILDLSLFRKAEMRRFMTAFLTKLYHSNRNPVHLMVDEADLFAPQRPAKDETHLLGAMEDVVRRGRVRGLGLTMITQRPAVIHKDVLTQIDTLVAHRLTGPQDRNAIDAWVSAKGSQTERDQMMETLSSLDTGECWIWSPQWLDVFEKIKVQKAKTFDSSATPKAGQRVEPKVVTPVDLDVLQDRMADTIERVKANDPKSLKAEVARLRKEFDRVAPFEEAFHTLRAERAEVQVETVEVVPPHFNDTLVRLTGLLTAVETMFEKGGVHMSHALREVDDLSGQINRTNGQQGRTVDRSIQTPSKPKPQVRRPAPRDTPGDTNLSKAERLVLTVLAQYAPDSKTAQQIAIISGYSHKGGGFRNALSSLRTSGYLDGRGDMTITEEGLDALGDFDVLPTGPELVDHWSAQLGKAERLVLQYLVDIYPNAADADEIGGATDYAPGGGGFRNALSKLRTLELIEGRGSMRASDDLFD